MKTNFKDDFLHNREDTINKKHENWKDLDEILPGAHRSAIATPPPLRRKTAFKIVYPPGGDSETNTVGRPFISYSTVPASSSFPAAMLCPTRAVVLCVRDRKVLKEKWKMLVHGPGQGKRKASSGLFVFATDRRTSQGACHISTLTRKHTGENGTRDPRRHSYVVMCNGHQRPPRQQQLAAKKMYHKPQQICNNKLQQYMCNTRGGRDEKVGTVAGGHDNPREGIYNSRIPPTLRTQAERAAPPQPLLGCRVNRQRTQLGAGTGLLYSCPRRACVHRRARSS